MKRVSIAAMIALFICQTVYAVKPHKPKKGLLEKANLTLPLDDITARSQESYTVKKFKKLTGRKPKLHERMGLKYLQIAAKKAEKRLLNRDTTDNSNACDKILFKNGDEVMGKVLTINKTQVKYKRCDWLDGPTYIKK